jgi:hypothetical protein
MGNPAGIVGYLGVIFANKGQSLIGKNYIKKAGPK